MEMNNTDKKPNNNSCCNDSDWKSEALSLNEDETSNSKLLTNKNELLIQSCNKIKFKKWDTILIKQMAKHELSMEKQKYYVEITEACVGQNNKTRNEALQTLVMDKELHVVLPQLCKFIMDGVQLNVVENSLTILIYLMRMLKAILDNQYIYLDKYLHQLIPSTITCIVSKDLGAKREYDYHWYLRDFASRLLAQICNTFNRSTNNIKSRIYKLFNNALLKTNILPMTTLYGILAGLTELGEEAAKIVILPHITNIAFRIDMKTKKMLYTDNDKASDRIRELLMKVLVPILMNIHKVPDNFDEYRSAYGYLADDLYNVVVQTRNTKVALNVQNGMFKMNSYNPAAIRGQNVRVHSENCRSILIQSVPHVTTLQNTINLITPNSSVNELLLTQKK